MLRISSLALSISPKRLFHISPKVLRSSSGIEVQSLTAEGNQSYVHNADAQPLLYRNIGQHVRLAAEKYPNNEAMVSCHEAKRFSFSDVMEKVDRLASSLHLLGLEVGDRVGIWAPNCSAYYLSSLAISRAGMIAVGINPAFQLPEVEYAMNKVQVKALVTIESYRSQKYYEVLCQLMPELAESSPGKLKSSKVPSLKMVIVDTESKRLPGTVTLNDMLQMASEEEISKIEPLQPLISPDSGAALLFTSGTTGHPKAALLSHFGLVNNGTHSAHRLELDRKQHRICLQVPLFHVFGMSLGLMASFNYGTALVFPSAGFQAIASLKAITEEKCTMVYGTPTMFVDLLNELQKDKRQLPPMDFALIGASSCSPNLILEVKEGLGVREVLAGYGMTEASGATFTSGFGDKTEVALSTVGKLFEHFEAKVVDHEGNTVPFGTAGELCLRGYGTMLGYWEEEQKTKEVLGADKWLKTGDQFVLRPDGYGTVVGRIKEVIIRGGENVYPKEIEDVLDTHPHLLEAYCIGVPDERLVEEICAFVRVKETVPDEAVNLEEIKQFCQGKLANFKIPRHLRIVEQFPKTTSGKIQKFKLLETFMAENKV
ncbi:medium-chain acyl-CoA ligase ACSF2, mitochondrial-like [Aedes albopictus]|uniref:Medium-chain acyl-CoA ligase ACSF2, mitochondrial n=1 Tax=Aedes albopictus TaxID=7160 RepID=A0ABM1Z7V8_AEDAL|nr:acyl-CoA synthetase family member 2, mitochondrial-like isoform X1 [Aedes albopictus]